MDLHEIIQKEKFKLIELRRKFHMYPELSFKEKKTSALVSKILKQAGYSVKENIAQTGVVATLGNNERNKKVLLIRADMDALPVAEQNNIPYKSKNANIMHACGHDAHLAISLTTAKIISTLRNKLNGSVKFVFQPAEEIGEGAKAMIEEGILNIPPCPTAAIALHVWNELPVGMVAIKSGPVFAAADKFEIEIMGKSGHGATPHLTIDPITITSLVVNCLQTIVSRRINPQEPAVVSIGKISAGSAFNIIPEKAFISGTTRAFQSRIMKQIRDYIQETVKSICKIYGAKYKLTFDGLTPPVVNDQKISEKLYAVAKKIIGEDNINTNLTTMGSEDMAFILQKVPGCYFLLGSGNYEKGITESMHSGRFNIDEDCLCIGVEILSNFILDYLRAE